MQRTRSLGIFLSGDILIKHFAIVGTAASRIMLLRVPNFLGDLVFTNYTIGVTSLSRITVKVDTVILEYILPAQNVKNYEILVCI